MAKSGSYPVNNREILKVCFRAGGRHDQSEPLGKINLTVMSRVDCKDSKAEKPFVNYSNNLSLM